METNFAFLKEVNSDLFNIAVEAEKLYRDEYFEQCMVQLRRFGENVCKNLLEKSAVAEETFDEMLAFLSDRTKGRAVEKEFVDDLYFLKKAGNQSAHGEKVKNDGMVALECLQRAFEVAINFAIAKGIDGEKVKSLNYDVTLLVTGEKTKKTLAEKYKEKAAQTKSNYVTKKDKIKDKKKYKQNPKENSENKGFSLPVVPIIFWVLIFLSILLILALIFLK